MGSYLHGDGSVGLTRHAGPNEPIAGLVTTAPGTGGLPQPVRSPHAAGHNDRANGVATPGTGRLSRCVPTSSSLALHGTTRSLRCPNSNSAGGSAPIRWRTK